MKRWCGLTDKEEIENEANRFEDRIVENAKRLQDMGKTGLIILPGVKDILESVSTTFCVRYSLGVSMRYSWTFHHYFRRSRSQLNKAPKPVWSIVTSARFKYASAALPTAAIPPHHHLVTANDVQKGKPNPEPYLKGAEKLGVDVKKCE